MPEGGSGSEAAQLRNESPEETRSQHQANTLKMLRLLPVPSVGRPAAERYYQHTMCPNREAHLQRHSSNE